MDLQALCIATTTAVNIIFDDTSESSSSDEEPERRIKRRRVDNYMETLRGLPSGEFKCHMRLKPETFEFLLQRIAPLIEGAEGRNHQTVIAKQLMIALWILGNQESYRSVCNLFDVGKYTGLLAVRRVVTALCNLAPTFIRWPTGVKIQESVDGFLAAVNFPGVIGAIDGCHIQIKAPKLNEASYVNRKSVHSINLQAVCNYNMLYTHCYAGEVGSIHDARVFRKSEVHSYSTEHANDKFPNGTHLVGDAAYPCSEQLMVPFRNNGHLTQQQRNYNYRHSATRMIIERSFAHLKGRWRRLKYLDMSRVDLIPKFMIACCVLHNICILQADGQFPEEPVVDEDHGYDMPMGDGNRNAAAQNAGMEKRARIAGMLPP